MCGTVPDERYRCKRAFLYISLFVFSPSSSDVIPELKQHGKMGDQKYCWMRASVSRRRVMLDRCAAESGRMVNKLVYRFTLSELCVSVTSSMGEWREGCN